MTKNLQCSSLESSCREALQLHPETITIFTEKCKHQQRPGSGGAVCVSLRTSIEPLPLASVRRGNGPACILSARCVVDLHLRSAWHLSGHPWNPVTHLRGISSDYIKKASKLRSLAHSWAEMPLLCQDWGDKISVEMNVIFPVALWDWWLNFQEVKQEAPVYSFA